MAGPYYHYQDLVATYGPINGPTHRWAVDAAAVTVTARAQDRDMEERTCSNPPRKQTPNSAASL